MDYHRNRNAKMDAHVFYKHPNNVQEEEMYGHFLDIEQQTTLTHRVVIRQHKGGFIVSQTDMTSIHTEPLRMFRNLVPVEPPSAATTIPDRHSEDSYSSKTHIYEDKYVFVISKVNVLRYTAVCVVTALFGCASAIIAATATTDISSK